MVTLQIPRPDLEHKLSKIREAVELARTRLQATHGCAHLFVTKRFTKLRRRGRAVDARLRQLGGNSSGSSEPFYINAPEPGGVFPAGFMGWLGKLRARRLARLGRLRGPH